MRKIFNDYFYLLIMITLLNCSSNKKNDVKFKDDVDFANYSKYINENKNLQKFVPDLIPNETAAIKLANLIWDTRYGVSKDCRVLAYTIKLEDDKVWFVKSNLPKGFLGEVFYIKINKYDGKILYVWSEG